MTTQNKDTRFLRAALRYAELGFRVFPLKPESKEPLVKDWPNQATNDRKIIQEWWSKYPNANIAILTGYYEHGFFCVLDFDPRNGGGWYSNADESVLPPTCVVITGSDGRHYYYLTDEPIPTKKLKEGVDLKGVGGYVVAPVSIHPNGNDYKWMEGRALGRFELARLPDWAFFEAIGGDDRKGHWRLNPPIPLGSRHNYVVSLAGVLWNAGLTIEQIVTIIRKVVELFETLEDYDVETEIKNLSRDLPKWQKKPQDINAVLAHLPAPVADIVEEIIDKTSPKSTKTKKEIGDKNGNKHEEKSSAFRNKRFDAVVKALLEEDWVLWGNNPHLLLRGRLIGVDYVYGFLYDKLGMGKIPKDDINAAITIVKYKKKPQEFDGLVLTDKLVYGVAEGIVGLWGHYMEEVYCYPVNSNSVLVWPLSNAPKGVYVKEGSSGLPIIPEQEFRKGEELLDTLLSYMSRSGHRLITNPLDVLCMLAPTFFGLGHAGFIFFGPASAGKSTFARAMALLESGKLWKSPIGNNPRDHIVVLAEKNKTTYFDEVGIVSRDLQDILKSKITEALFELRDLFSNSGTSTYKLSGSVIISTIGIKGDLKADFLDRFMYITFTNDRGSLGAELDEYAQNNNMKARAGLIHLFKLAYEEETPKSVPVSVRFLEWYRWGYRFAKVLGREQEFENTVKYSKLDSMRNSVFGFLVDFFKQGKVEEGKPYKIADIYVDVHGVNADTSSAIRRLYGYLTSNTEALNTINTIANAAGYEVRLEKQVLDKQKGKKVLVLIFNKKQEKPTEEVLKEIEQDYNKMKHGLTHVYERLNKKLGLQTDQKENNTTQENPENQTKQELPPPSEVKSDAKTAGADKRDDTGDDDDNPEDTPPPDGGGSDDGGNDNSGGGGSAPSDEYCEYEEEEIEEQYTDPMDNVDYKAQQGQAAVNEDPPASAIIYEGEKISIDDVKRYVKLILTDFLEDPPNKKDQAIQKLTEYIDIVNKKLREEDLHTAMQYIQSQINTIKMIALLNGKKIDFAEPYIPPSPKEVPVRAQPAPAPAPPAPPPPKPPAPPITNHHSLESAPAPAPPAPPKPPPTPPPIQNQIPPPAPPAPPPEPPPKPASPRLNYQTDDDFLGFMYAQMKNIRRNGGGDNEVAAYLLGLREEVAEYLRQKGLNHALFILEATLKSFFVARRM